jgi:hypothetical protein
MFSLQSVKVKDIYLQIRFLKTNVLFVCRNLFERKKICKVLLMLFRHTLFVYKGKTRLLLQIIYAMLMKEH